jgi:hypothetical protein
MRSSRTSFIALGLVAAALEAATGGCNLRPATVPVRGKVLYRGEPLKFGVVMFHPAQGQVAQGAIESDGSFQLSTFRLHDGAQPGAYHVSVMCYEGHDPQRAPHADETGEGMTLGRPLIPLKYTRAKSSGLLVDVPAEGVSDVVLELSGP